MALLVTEYAGYIRGIGGAGVIPQEPALAITSLSSGSSAASSTLSFNANSRVARISADVNSFYIIGSSTALVASSSLSQRIAAGTERLVGVRPFGKLIGYST